MIDNPAETMWMEDAKCRGLPKEDARYLFFSETDVNSVDGIAFCSDCPVRHNCLSYAMTDPYGIYGIWGGMSRRGRIRLAKQGRTRT